MNKLDWIEMPLEPPKKSIGRTITGIVAVTLLVTGILISVAEKGLSSITGE